MNKDNEKRIKEKLDFFLAEKIKVHIEKTDKMFLNGILSSKLRDNTYLLKEDKLGTIYVFVSEIYDVDEFREKGAKK